MDPVVTPKENRHLGLQYLPDENFSFIEKEVRWVSNRVNGLLNQLLHPGEVFPKQSRLSSILKPITENFF